MSTPATLSPTLPPPVAPETLSTTPISSPAPTEDETSSVTVHTTQSSTHTLASVRSDCSVTASLTCSSLTSTSGHSDSTLPKTPDKTTKPPARTAPKALSNLQKYQSHILQLTNTIRLSHSAPPVTLSPLLNAAARLHNTDVALNIGDLSHVSSDGRTLTERLLEQGYDFRYASENLARGQRDCRWVMNSWMKSPGHRRNVVNARVREMGLHVGIWKDRMYWCQVFGVRRGYRG